MSLLDKVEAGDPLAAQPDAAPGEVAGLSTAARPGSCRRPTGSTSSRRTSATCRCIMCPTGRKEQVRKKGYMDFELFKSIVDEMAPWVQATTLHIWGEPLMHPKMFDMIEYCRDKGLRSEISTNATLLNEERAQAHPGRGAGRDLPVPGWHAAGDLRADSRQRGLRKDERATSAASSS